jgi:hypothetical protein
VTAEENSRAKKNGQLVKVRPPSLISKKKEKEQKQKQNKNK